MVIYVDINNVPSNASNLSAQNNLAYGAKDTTVWHRAFNFALKLIVETIKIAATAIFLHLLTQKFLISRVGDVASFYDLKISTVTVQAPIIEEIFCRGWPFIASRLSQIGWKYFRGHELWDAEYQCQSAIEIHLSALAFAAAHLANPQSVATTVAQFATTYFYGVKYGYIVEKYRTLSLPILLHGTHNILAVAAVQVYPQAQFFLCLGIIANACAAHAFAMTDIDKKIYVGMQHASQFMADLPGRCRRWYAGEEPAVGTP